MNQETIKLFQENYENRGSCEKLPTFVKVIEKEFKKANTVKRIKYYPWAVIERIFRMQGGKIEIVNWVESIELNSMEMTPNENGEMVLQEQKTKALFIRLKATWQGMEEEEFYPIFDNQNARIIRTPDALDLNTARQRGMVRLIARISGIGLEIFEQQEGQFEEDTPNNNGEKFATKVEEPKRKEEPKTKVLKKETDAQTKQTAMEELVAPVKQEVKEEPKKDDGFFKQFISGQTIEPAQTKQVEQPLTVEKAKIEQDSQEHAELLLEVRKIIREKNSQGVAKEFILSKKKELLSQLSYEELLELKQLI